MMMQQYNTQHDLPFLQLGERGKCYQINWLAPTNHLQPKSKYQTHNQTNTSKKKNPNHHPKKHNV